VPKLNFLKRKRKRLHPWLKDVSKVRTTCLMPTQMIYVATKCLVSIGTKDLGFD
jgi:hypothetical protein